MSAEGGSSQPPSTAGDKAQAPKAPTTFSAFINKNTSGKKFAPKAARRRPGPAAAAPAPRSHAPEATPTAESQSQTPQTQPELTTVPTIGAQTTLQLPTLDATQERATPDRTQRDQQVSRTSPTLVGQSNAARTHTTIVEPSTSSITTGIASIPQQQRTVELSHISASSRAATPRRAGDDIVSARLPKRQRVTSAELETPREILEGAHTVSPVTTNGSVPTPQPLNTKSQPTSQQSHEDDNQGSLSVTSTVVDESTEAAESTNQQEETGPTETQEAQPTIQRNRPPRRQQASWTAVNEQQDEENSAPARRTRQSAKARGKRKATTNGVEEEALEDGEDEATAAPKRPSAKARGNKKATDAAADDGNEASERPARKPRKPKKRKNQDVGEGREADGDAEEPGEQVDHRKKKRRKKADQQKEGEGEGQKNARQPKRRGRPSREGTPSDAENHEIDPENTFMDHLASRNIRVGRLSERERKMRQINWNEVRQRRREEEEAGVGRNQEAEDEVNRRLNEAGAARDEAMPQASGPQFREVNGQIMLIQDSGTIDRQADADRDIELMETVEEDDLTARVTNRSFMKNNKRFPNEFLLPGQGKRWTTAATEEFYRGLSMFGTDFQMISTMFPGTTRRSIKTKFVREERQDPERVKKALHGQLDMDWDYYLNAAQLKDEAFVDADEIKKDLQEKEEQHLLELEAAKETAMEERRQRQLAGIESENEDAGDKENGKGKKKRKERTPKRVSFAQEEGVEVLGNVDDDPNWLQQ